jgi:hypothetical protein
MPSPSANSESRRFCSSMRNNLRSGPLLVLHIFTCTSARYGRRCLFLSNCTAIIMPYDMPSVRTSSFLMSLMYAHRVADFEVDFMWTVENVIEHFFQFLRPPVSRYIPSPQRCFCSGLSPALLLSMAQMSSVLPLFGGELVSLRSTAGYK